MPSSVGELPVRQVAGVLQHGVFGAAHALRGILVPVAPRLVPQTFPDLVQGAGHPGDDVEAVQYAFGVRAPPADARVNPAGPVAGDDLDGGALFGVNALKNRSNTSPPTPSCAQITRCRSWSTTTVRYAVALPVAGPVHADRGESVERRGHRRLDTFRDPTGDGAGGSSTTHEGNR